MVLSMPGTPSRLRVAACRKSAQLRWMPESAVSQPASIVAQTDCSDSASDRPPSLIRSQTSDATSPSSDSASPKPPAPATSRPNW